ncbi:MAG: hypothetical protein A07HR67_02141 [uncultured archaeon A07HR67]|nr:MAG: hypothetical protein A07HR67_02141 [uncultured archaeon A07HR67]
MRLATAGLFVSLAAVWGIVRRDPRGAAIDSAAVARGASVRHRRRRVRLGVVADERLDRGGLLGLCPGLLGVVVMLNPVGGAETVG